MRKILLALFVLCNISIYAWATVPNATPLFNQYNCNSSTTQFPYAFPIASTSDMTVYTTDSSGTITQQTSTFSVDTTNVWVNYPLTGSPCPTGSTITLIPSTPQTQITAYTSRAPFTATAVGASFDKLTLIAQQLQGQINRAFLQPVNFTGTATFPSSSPGNYIGWNGSGQLANIPSPSNAALWTLSGATAVYNLGNVSTTNNFTAGSINWTSIQPIKNTEVNWTSLNNNVQTGGVNWGSLLNSEIQRQGINWPSTNIFPTSSTGNVGVGSSNPGKTLDVSGIVRSISGGFIFPDGSTQTVAKNSYVGSFTFDSALNTNFSVTGVGFRPTSVIFFANLSTNVDVSWGVMSAANQGCIYFAGTAGHFSSRTTVPIDINDGTNETIVDYVSMDSDGFTLSRALTAGSPAGTVTVNFIAFE